MSPHTFTDAPEPESTSRGGTWVAIVLLCLIVAGVGGFFVNRTLNQIDQLNTQIDTLETSVQRTVEDAGRCHRTRGRGGTSGAPLRGVARTGGGER